MRGVEGAEYGFTRIFVWRGTIVTGARFRCRTRLGLAARPARCARGAAIFTGAARPSGCPPVAAGAAENLLT
jgi:hypothetical protein